MLLILKLLLLILFSGSLFPKLNAESRETRDTVSVLRDQSGRDPTEVGGSGGLKAIT